ncbi:hypothetical protein NLP_30050 (plasmid) [Nostoc sp. 'Lobaria pulmonaria (5183) cyanobiont']|nr:hypothetical protein NLP_30050 [Nostoc sp. 'Lobaria pulmonaria (5183) cyanobiont']
MRKSKRRLKPGDQVEFTSHDEKCKPFKQTGIVKVYLYPDFHPNGYIEIVDDNGDTILYGNAGDNIQKSK